MGDGGTTELTLKEMDSASPVEKLEVPYQQRQQTHNMLLYPTTLTPEGNEGTIMRWEVWGVELTLHFKNLHFYFFVYMYLSLGEGSAR